MAKRLSIDLDAHQIEAMKIALSLPRPSPTVDLRSCLPKRISSRIGITIVLTVACFLTVPAYSGVTVLWEQYQCSGDPEDTFYAPPYSITDSSPVSASNYTAYSSAWKFGASASTMGNKGWASASSTFVITVDVPILIIMIDGNLDATGFPDTQGGISYSLTDNFTGGIIGGKSWIPSMRDRIGDDSTGRWARTVQEYTTYDLVIGNPYKLLISANVTNADGSHASIRAVLIPEPSSLLLLSIGALRGLFLRRRFP